MTVEFLMNAFLHYELALLSPTLIFAHLSNSFNSSLAMSNTILTMRDVYSNRLFILKIIKNLKKTLFKRDLEFRIIKTYGTNMAAEWPLHETEMSRCCDPLIKPNETFVARFTGTFDNSLKGIVLDRSKKNNFFRPIWLKIP